MHFQPILYLWLLNYLWVSTGSTHRFIDHHLLVSFLRLEHDSQTEVREDDGDAKLELAPQRSRHLPLSCHCLRWAIPAEIALVHGPHHPSRYQRGRGFFINVANDSLHVPLDAFVMRSGLMPLTINVSEKEHTDSSQLFSCKSLITWSMSSKLRMA